MSALILVLLVGVGLVLGFIVIGLIVCGLEGRHESPGHRIRGSSARP